MSSDDESAEKNRKHKEDGEERKRRKKKKKEKHEKAAEEKRDEKKHEKKENEEEEDRIMKPSKEVLRRTERREEKRREECNLWDIAVEMMSEKIKVEDNDNRSVVVIGSKGSGKTTIFSKCLGRSDDNVKPTIGIDYNFVKKNVDEQGVAKSLGHIWEVGGGVLFGKLLDNVIQAKNIRQTHIILVVDASNPRTLWTTFEGWMHLLTSRCNDVIRKDDDASKLKTSLQEKMKANYKSDHPDVDLLDLQMLPILVVANKYDALQNMEGDERRLICKALRFLCHRVGAHLQFCSAAKMDSLVGKVKTFFDSFLFGSPINLPLQTAHNKPLTILAGHDSFQDIGMPPVDDVDTGRFGAKTPFDLWKYTFNKKFPQEDPEKLVAEVDPTLDPQYKEAEIDAIKTNKDQELSSYMKSLESKKLISAST